MQNQSYAENQSGMVVNTAMTIIPELYPKDWTDKTQLCEQEMAKP